jgi:hypothetical protein
LTVKALARVKLSAKFRFTRHPILNLKNAQQRQATDYRDRNRVGFIDPFKLFT